MKTINLKSIIVVIALFFAGTTISLAQHDHSSHGTDNSSGPADHPPHGGAVKKVGKFYIEMVVNMMQKKDNITVYILNSKGKAMSNADITGTIMFMFKDGSSTDKDLRVKGTDKFVSELGENKSFTGMISFTIKGKKYSTNIDYVGLDSPAISVVFSCPMHPEVTDTKASSCSKCGMTLVKEK
jgi:Heavy metal binding domain